MHIYIEQPLFKVFTLGAEPDSTIGEIKGYVEVKFEHLVDDLHLICGSKTLKDQNTLEYYNIQDGSSLKLTTNNTIKLQVKFLNGALRRLNVCVSDTIGSVEDDLLAMLDMPSVNVSFILNGIRLEHDLKFSEYDIQNNTLLFCPLRLQVHTIPIYVKTLDANTLTFYLEPSDSIA